MDNPAYRAVSLTELVKIRPSRTDSRSILSSDETRNRDRRQNADNDDNNEQLDQGETALGFLVVQILEHLTPPLSWVFSFLLDSRQTQVQLICQASHDGTYHLILMKFTQTISVFQTGFLRKEWCRVQTELQIANFRDRRRHELLSGGSMP
jgi:hypothetical protein